MVYYKTKADQLKAEQEAGRRTVVKRKVEELVDVVRKNHGLEFKFTQGASLTDWCVTSETGERYSADEFIAMAMLLGDV